ncbi:MAG: hypothetical protein ACF8R7_07455, partial [Phycisphaerales bacterium JB039]
MRVVHVSSAAVIALAAGQVASAQFFEGFEHGDWSGNYTWLGSGSSTPNVLDSVGARTGSFGCTFTQNGWWQNSDSAAVIEDGSTFEYWFRGSGARVYIGFTSDTSATQAYTVVAAPNTGNVIIQRNNGFGFSDLASTPISWSASEFYQVVASYESGVISVEVFDGAGFSLGTTMADTGYDGGGRLLLRGFGGTVYADDIDLAAGGPNALVLDWSSNKAVGADATAAAGLTPLITTDGASFEAALPTAMWRMVTIDNPSNSFAASTSDAIADYIDTGGRVHMSYWNLDADPTLQSAFGVSGTVDFFDPRPVFADAVPHPSWGALTSVPIDTAPSPWADNGDELSVVGGCSGGEPEVIGVFDSAGSGIGAIVTAGGRTLVNGYDYDSMQTGTMLDLATSQIRWLRTAEPGGPPPRPSCYPDCDGNKLLDFFDFLCFQNAFGTGDCYADCDESGALDFFDFLCFQNEFATFVAAGGCPTLELFQLGVEAPPSVICGETMESVVDPRPTFSDVTTVPTSIGDITFDIACSHRVIGGGWGSWSHGYTGDVYYT